MNDLDSYLKIATEISKKVGHFIIGEFGSVKEMSHKGGTHYTIKEDKIANDMYEEFLRKETPDIGLYTEEGERNLDKELVWIIDPIDGTSNYRVGNPFFVTQIALLHKGEPVVAVVYAPILNMEFSAIKGMGVFCNGKKIQVSLLSQMEKSLVAFSKGTDKVSADWLSKTISLLSDEVRTIRVFGSLGLDLSFTASGKIDIYVNSGSDLYDYAPGVLLIREAGGEVLNHDGDQWTYQDKTVVAGNKALVEEVVKILKGL
jgi:myo-inositol-1(or 4)-monophosphatase